MARLVEHMTAARGSQGLKPYAEQYAALATTAFPRRFFVSRLGGSGSAWFAKTLNSHPDVFCSHEGANGMVYPRDGITLDDHDRFIGRVASEGYEGTYDAVGDVGSTWLGRMDLFPRAWSTGFLIRHPVRTLLSLLHHYPRGEEYPPLSVEDRQRATHLFEVEVDDLVAKDQFLLHHATAWVYGILHMKFFRGGDQLIRLEDMTDPAALGAVAWHLTGVDYPARLLNHAIQKRVNVREAKQRDLEEVIQDFSPQQRRWLATCVGPFAALIGYHIPGT